jgi:SAM-dependent methyltransferase
MVKIDMTVVSERSRVTAGELPRTLDRGGAQTCSNLARPNGAGLGLDGALELIRSGDVLPGMCRLVSVLAQERARLSPLAWQSHIQTVVIPHPIRQVAHLDPITRRASAKPRGYAGDAVMMDQIYGLVSDELNGLGVLARRVAGYCRSSPASEAVRFRRSVLAECIDAEAERHARKVRVTAIACGHLREADLSAAIRTDRAAVTAIDQDRESLARLRHDYANLDVQPVAASVRQILAGKVKLPPSDLAYTAGLYAYLGQATALRLTQLIYESLRPGGRMLIANFLPDVPDAGYMEAIMDWKLIYRTDDEMKSLLTGIPSADIDAVEQFHDPFHNITFLSARKVTGS